MLLSQLTIALIAALPNAGATTGWQADYGVALAETREAAKPLVVVIDRPGVEGESLDAELLSPASGAFPLDSFELCHVDASTAYGKQVAQVFHVTSFPHVAIIDKTGSVILKRMSGTISRDTWALALREHQDGQRAGVGRYTVAKPVVTASGSGETGVTTPAYSAPTQFSPSTGGFVMPTTPSPQPYCPSCQLR
ncbi:hypothetical protein [Botrimarina hoheduenensis]|uniref:Thioredoxin domain-containing protein n=1 Tax=Botrimarina hoheduenensis TaxID=2528000 RepID=A0A5C5WC65_9BACT|nr:hypothetical protein [Botrimarina hoheduenensis]TWT47679.1 hypothetical protein Pla111_12980 [Botrimarina hoheduenensis]